VRPPSRPVQPRSSTRFFRAKAQPHISLPPRRGSPISAQGRGNASPASLAVALGKESPRISRPERAEQSSAPKGQPHISPGQKAPSLGLSETEMGRKALLSKPPHHHPAGLPRLSKRARCISRRARGVAQQAGLEASSQPAKRQLVAARVIPITRHPSIGGCCRNPSGRGDRPCFFAALLSRSSSHVPRFGWRCRCRTVSVLFGRRLGDTGIATRSLWLAGNRRSDTLAPPVLPAVGPLWLAGNRRSDTLLRRNCHCRQPLWLAGNRRSDTLSGF